MEKVPRPWVADRMAVEYPNISARGTRAVMILKAFLGAISSIFSLSEVQVIDDFAGKIVGNGHFDGHDGFEQDRSGFLERIAHGF